MTKIAARAHVHADGTLEIRVPSALPPGDHTALVIVETQEQAGTGQMDGFPIDIGAREPAAREDLYHRNGR